jgi:hypothetical protein
MIIFTGAYYLRRYFKNNDLDSDIIFARLESSYLNDKLGVQYLKHFNY